MNGEVEVLKIKAIGFPQKFEMREIVENKIIVETAAVETIKKAKSGGREDRFVRLKKHLRKRSASIL